MNRYRYLKDYKGLFESSYAIHFPQLIPWFRYDDH
jgi:hypothetical protein